MAAACPRTPCLPSLVAEWLGWLPLLLIVAGTADAASRNVEAWVAEELADYVLVQLTTVPRFADATVHLVVFSDGQPAPRTNALSLALRDSLRRSLVGRGGVRLGWQAEPDDRFPAVPTTAEQCDAMQPDLLVGIELRFAGSGEAFASVRALDESEQRWIEGFGQEWQGELTAQQGRAFATPAVDRSFLGRRDAPYGPSETDLIANHLARDLRCQLMRQVSGEYLLGAVAAAAEGDPLAAVPSLVRHQVGGVSSLRLIASADEANAELHGDLHPVTGTLHQYWLVLDPIDSGEAVQPLSSSVYVELPDAGAVKEVAGRGPALPSPTADVLSDMRLVRLAGDAACAGSAPAYRYRHSEHCMALRVTAGSDAVVFILNHQRTLGLVRLGDAHCAPRPRAHVLRKGQSITIPVPDLASVEDAEWTSVADWSMAPAGDVWYAIASNDSEAARAIAKHVATLPARCSESIRPGLDGAALAHWFRGFGAELERRAGDVDWRAVQPRNLL